MVGFPIKLLGAFSGVTNGLVAASDGVLAIKVPQFYGDNASGTTLYLQLFDALSLPVNGTPAAAQSMVSFGVASAPTENPRHFAPSWIPFVTGVYFAWSTTPGVLTLAGSGTGLAMEVYSNV